MRTAYRVLLACPMLLALAACETAPTRSVSLIGSPVTAGYGSVETFNDANFRRQVLMSPRPVLVDCWAPWCGPCRAMEPVIDDLAAEYSGQIKVGKLDVTTSPATAREYGLSALPAFLVFKDGRVVKRIVGYQAKGNLKTLVSAAAQ